MLNPRRVLSKVPDPRPDLELRLRRRRQRGGDVRELPAQEARRHWSAAHPHGARRGLLSPSAPGVGRVPAPASRSVVVGLVAVGLLVSDAVMYTSLRSFLLVRVDQQLQEAVGPGLALLAWVHRAKGRHLPAGDRPHGQTPRSQLPPGAPPALLPPGTYGELREPRRRGCEAGAVHLRRDFGGHACAAQSSSRPPLGPRRPGPLLRFTVGASGGSSMQYRVLAVTRTRVGGDGDRGGPPDRGRRGPSTGCSGSSSPSTVGVLLGLAGLSWWIVRRGLRPLDRMGVTAAAIADGDLSRRVEVTDPRTEVGRLGLSLNAMLAQIERAFAERLASEERLAALPGGRFSRAAHSPHVHPRIRGALPSRRRAAS